MNFLRLIKAESYTRGMVFSVLFNMISKGILFLLTIIIARYFGSNIKTDIYFFVFATMILFSGFINNIDTAVLIPESMRLRNNVGEKEANAFLNYFLFIYVMIGVLFTVFMWLFGTTVFGWISKFSEGDIITYAGYFRLGSCFFIFHLLTNYLNSILTSLKFFSLPMIISSIKSCIVIVCIFLLRADYDVQSVILGGLISYALNLLIQLYILYAIAGWKPIFKKPSIAKKTWSNVVYAELGQAATVASSLFPLYLLSGFGSGVISVMNYGKNIADIPNTLITSQLANVGGIQLNEQSARLDYAGMNKTFLELSKLMVFLLVPLGCFMYIFAEPLVALFYDHGHFTQHDVVASAKFMKLLSVTIFSIGVNAIVTRLFIAMQAIRQAFFYQLVLNVMLIIAVWAFTKQYSEYGYPYGIILINCINFVGMYFICKKHLTGISYGRLMVYSLKIFVINLVVTASLYFLLLPVQFNNLYKLIAGILVYMVLIILMPNVKGLGIAETNTAYEKA